MVLKAEAASPSSVYRVLAVWRGGGTWVGTKSRQAGGLLGCISRTFLARGGTGAVHLSVPLTGRHFRPIGRVFNTAYCDACTIGSRSGVAIFAQF